MRNFIDRITESIGKKVGWVLEDEIKNKIECLDIFINDLCYGCSIFMFDHVREIEYAINKRSLCVTKGIRSFEDVSPSE